MGPWTIPNTGLDGSLFAARYGLNPDRDFYVLAGQLHLADGVTIKDDPPIFDPPLPRRKPRPLREVHDDVMALSKTQRDTIWADVSMGTPEKYLLDAGQHIPQIIALHCVGKIGQAPDDHTQAGIMVFYALDNPRYLVMPAFDPSINIPGDMPA